METINQQPQTETLNVTTLLDSNSNQGSPQTTEENVKKEDSTSVQQNTNEENDLQDETLTSTTTDIDSKNETTNIQLPLEDKKDFSNNNDEDEPMGISADSGDECHKIHIDNEAQQVEMQPVEQPQPQTQPHEEENVGNSGHTNEIKCNESDDDEITSSQAKKCKYDDKYDETKEDELLKFDNEDVSEDEQQKDSTVSDDISMEREEELLKSDDDGEELLENKDHKIQTFKNETREVDDEELLENEDHIEIRNNETREETQTPEENKIENDDAELNSKSPIQNSIEDFEGSNLYKKQQQDTDNEENIDIRLKGQQEDCKRNTDSVNLCNEDSVSSKGSYPRENSAVEENKKRKSAENHRILYQFDLDEDSSSLDSFNSSKSPIFNENKTESTHDKSPSNQMDEIETQQTISETADINDVEKVDCEETTTQEDRGEHLNEEMKKHFSPHTVSPNSNELHLDDKVPQSDVENLVSKKDDTQEEHESIKSSWNSLHSNSFSSKENLTIEEKQSHDENFENDMSDYNDDQADEINSKEEDKDEARNFLVLLKLNGNHDSCDQYSEAEPHENTHADNISNNDDSNLLKTSRLTEGMNVRSPTPEHSPVSLPQNEEAQAEFEGTLNEEDSNSIHDSKTQDNAEHNEEHEPCNEKNFKINEINSAQADQDSNHNKDIMSPSPPPRSPIQNQDDEASRSSMASSASYSSSTSSSQHLVIDHPMDDLKEERVKPLKISLKRKLSNLSNDRDSMSPREKRFYLSNEEQKDEFSEKSDISNDEEMHEQMEKSGFSTQEQLHMDIKENLLMESTSKEQEKTDDQILNMERINELVS